MKMIFKCPQFLNGCFQMARVQDESKLPVSWLAGNTGLNEATVIIRVIILYPGEHATSMDALWALRDFMLQEALGVVKIM